MYFKLTSDCKREKWTVKVVATALVTCCHERIAYHRKRGEFWANERENAERELRDNGISLKQFSVTGGTRTQATLDESMAERVTECQQKQREHADSFNRFVAYRAMFALLKGNELELTADDVLYFNIEGADVDT